MYRLCLLLALLLPLPVPAEDCPIVRITPERLPDLTMPRSGNNIFYAGGELTVTGGHTTNFVTTPTAEYYTEGKWHQMTMAYSHDNGFAVILGADEVIIGGGHDQPLGIGQTYMLERYNPKKHTFEGFGCLDRRRVLANSTLLGDGRVIIVGNHYAEDAIGYYDGRNQVQPLKDVVQGRSNPYILRTANDDAVIIGAYDQQDKRPDTVWADRVKGNAFRVPLLEQWHLMYTDHPFFSETCSMGDYTYLLPAINKSGQLGIIMVRDTCFSLLPTTSPIPMQSPFGPIFYKNTIVIDKKRQRGYFIGVDSLYHRQYILSIDYAKLPAALTLYHTDSIENATITIPVVSPEGDLILAGGIPGNNYKPLAAVWCYHFGTAPQTAVVGLPIWLWVVLVVAAITALIYLIQRRKKNTRTINVIESQQIADASQLPTSDNVDNKTLELMERISQLMDEKQLYLRSNLKLQDVAVRLNTNSSYVSECINNVYGQSFSQFVNTYRIRHAQEMLRCQPNLKTSAIAIGSGFSRETSFFRNFKAVTGMTPREWVGTLQSQIEA